MAGIYIHVPFCKTRCPYCNFYSVTDLSFRKQFMEAMLLEASLQAFYLSEETIDTIYFGGGTPSLMRLQDIQRIFEEIEKNYTIGMGVEITLEANPDDITDDFLLELKSTPVNRLSLGTQSFHDGDLKILKRRHTAKQSIRSVEKALEAGFPNLSMDLIYGIPGQTLKTWREDLALTVQLGAPHISAYCMTVEPGTRLEKMIAEKKVTAPDEAKSVKMFDTAIDTLADAGYLHYEISNYCREGWQSRHNSSYWEGKKYLGLGPSAHSYNGNQRQWNVSSVKDYIQSLENGNVPATAETLTEKDKYNEYVMTALRTIRGVKEETIKKFFGTKFSSYFRKAVQDSLQQGRVEKNGDVYTLTRDGKRMCDAVTRELFYV